MHILLIHQVYSELDEAGGTRHAEMARMLVKHGHQVTVIASPISYLTGQSQHKKIRWVEKQTPIPGMTVLRTYTFKTFHRNFVLRVLSFFSFMFSSFWVGLSVRNVDMIWGTSPPIFQGWTAWVLSKLKRAPFLFEIRDLWPEFAIAVGVLRNRLLIRLSLWLERFLYTHADQLIVNSPGFINHISNKGGKNILLVPNGADPAMFNPENERENIREKHLWQDKFVVLYAGAHGMSNDLEVVLQAAKLLEENKTIHFVFVGDGKEKTNLIEKSRQMLLTNVEFLPAAPKNQMAAILSAVDACIAILKPIEMYKTTYPNKVFDYMAAGKPIVMAIDGASREVVEEAGAGLFSLPGDPGAMAAVIKQLFNEPMKSRQMGLAGRQYIKTHLNRDDISEQFVKLVETLT